MTTMTPAQPKTKELEIQPKNSLLARARARAAAENAERRGAPLGWHLWYRGVVVVIDYLLVVLLATTVLPMFGVWLHQQATAANSALTLSGTIALWVMPLLFITLLLAAAVFVTARALWRWSSARIAGHRRDAAVAQEPAARTAPMSQGSKRKKGK